MKFNIVMFKERYKNITKVINEGIYKPTFNAMCYLFENDLKNKNTVTAFNKILENYVEFEKINNNSNTAITRNTYRIDLTKMPIEIMEALKDRANLIKERKENFNKNLETEVVNLLSSDEFIQ